MWIKTEKLGERVDEPSENEFPPVIGAYSDRIMGDEERNVLRTCGTRALLGSSRTKLQAQSRKY